MQGGLGERGFPRGLWTLGKPSGMPIALCGHAVLNVGGPDLLTGPVNEAPDLFHCPLYAKLGFSKETISMSNHDLVFNEDNIYI